MEDGTWIDGHTPRKRLCPNYITNLIESVELDLSQQVDRFLKLLRWRQNCDASSEVLKHQSLYWRVGKGVFHIAPYDTAPNHGVSFNAMFGIHWTKRHIIDLQNLWSQADILEPLGHTLLREAIALSHESPRSAILMLAASLETAVKIHIGRNAPDTAWLMEELQSPPIFKILKNYIPLVHKNKGSELEFWNKLNPEFNKIQKLIEVRNKIAHTGKLPDKTEPIQSSIELVSNFLYLLDVLDGHEWAKSLLSQTLRKELGWPDPVEIRFKITMQQGY